MFQTELSVYIDAVDQELEDVLDGICDLLRDRGYGVQNELDDVRAFLVARPIEEIPDTEQAVEDWMAEALANSYLAAIPKAPGKEDHEQTPDA